MPRAHKGGNGRKAPRRWLLLAAAVAAGGVLPTGAPSSRSADPALQLTALASTVPQGVPFVFAAKVSSGAPIADAILFSLSHGNRTVSFSQQLALVAPGTTTEIGASVTPSQWFAGLGTFELRAFLGGRSLGAPLAFKVTAPRVIVPVFKDVTAVTGLTTSLPETVCGRWSSGAAWADVNGDGRLDLFVTRQGLPEQLFVARPSGGFRDEAAARGVDGGSSAALGASFADYDNDGDPDLYVAADGFNRLYRNDGTGHFQDIAASAGVTDTATSISMSASWADYDGDGLLDLYVTDHANCRGDITLRTLDFQPDKLFHNEGKGKFTDRTALFEHDLVVRQDGYTSGAGFLGSWFDYNGDGRPDLYLANDYLGGYPDRNHLWRNDGRGADGQWQLTDVSVESGTQFAMNTMGVAVGDYNRDLRLDLALSNYDSKKVLRNNGDGTFTDMAPALGADGAYRSAQQRSITWGLELRDLNLDGWEDLYVADGYLVGAQDSQKQALVPQRNEVLVNDRGRSFLDVSAPSHGDDDGQSRGVAVADFDRDGRLDVYVVNQGGAPHLYRNVTPRAGLHWLEVKLTGTRSNRDACGARVVASVAHGSMLRAVLCGSTSVSSGSDTALHFGLGKVNRVSLAIKWPSGLRQTIRNVRADRQVTLVEPKV